MLIGASIVTSQAMLDRSTEDDTSVALSTQDPTPAGGWWICATGGGFQQPYVVEESQGN